MNRASHPGSRGLWLAAACLLTACGGGIDAGTDGGTPVPDRASCLALPSEITWHRDHLSSEWTDVAVDGQGRLWVAGWTGGTVGESDLEPTGNSRPVLRVLRADGTALWDLGPRFDTPGADTLEALAITSTGTVYVAGRTQGSLDGRPNAGQFDTFVAWSDGPADGQGWQVLQTGTSAPQHPRRLAVDAQGAVVLVGEDDDHVPSNYVEAWRDAFAWRWQRTGAGTTSDRLVPGWHWQAGSLEADLSGGLALASAAQGGASYAAGSTLTGANRGAVLRKWSAAGGLVWSKRYTTGSYDEIAAVRLLADGSLLIGGTVSGAFGGGIPHGQQDVFVARIDAQDGHVLESWQFGSAASDRLTDLQVDAEGQVVLFGETLGQFAPDAVPAGQTDLFLLRMAPDGRVLARRQWGTADDERAGRLALDRCGHAVAVGGSGTVGRRDAVTWFWPR